jgi:hypothetical protein
MILELIASRSPENWSRRIRIGNNLIAKAFDPFGSFETSDAYN